MFSVIVAPMIMFGCAYYPWRGLDVVPVLKYAVLVNPLVYVAEGLRGALTPALPHMPLPVVLAALALMTACSGASACGRSCAARIGSIFGNFAPCCVLRGRR